MEITDADLRAQEHYRRDVDYAIVHYEELLQRYPEHWVAIYGEQVVGAEPDFDRLLENLDRKRIPTNHTFVKYLSAEPIEFILGDALLI
jgi:hypothetical protein